MSVPSQKAAPALLYGVEKAALGAFSVGPAAMDTSTESSVSLDAKASRAASFCPSALGEKLLALKDTTGAFVSISI